MKSMIESVGPYVMLVLLATGCSAPVAQEERRATGSNVMSSDKLNDIYGPVNAAGQDLANTLDQRAGLQDRMANQGLTTRAEADDARSEADQFRNNSDGFSSALAEERGICSGANCGNDPYGMDTQEPFPVDGDGNPYYGDGEPVAAKGPGNDGPGGSSGDDDDGS
jgi:hypothetical protein